MDILPEGLSDRTTLLLEDRKGLKTLRSDELDSPVLKRDDLTQASVVEKIERGSRAQKLRYRVSPSINVDRDSLYAGYIEGDLEEARDRLQEMAYRNNPTAYVEVTDENGPDDGSYARQYVTEKRANIDRPHFSSHPTLFKRYKRQIHVCIWKVGDRVEFLAHEERSAWLQPMLHVQIPDVNASRGVRDFRNDWYDVFGRELNGKEDVRWDTTN